MFIFCMYFLQHKLLVDPIHTHIYTYIHIQANMTRHTCKYEQHTGIIHANITSLLACRQILYAKTDIICHYMCSCVHIVYVWSGGICIYSYVHVYACICMYLACIWRKVCISITNTYVHISECICMYCMYVYVYACMCIYMYVCLYMHVWVHMCIYYFIYDICMYVLICVCIDSYMFVCVLKYADTYNNFQYVQIHTIYVDTYTYIHIHTHTYTYIHTHKCADANTDTYKYK